MEKKQTARQERHTIRNNTQSTQTTFSGIDSTKCSPVCYLVYVIFSVYKAEYCLKGKNIKSN